VTDWTVRSYIRRYDNIAFQDDDTCKSAILECLCYTNVSNYGTVRSVEIGDGISKQTLLLRITNDTQCVFNLIFVCPCIASIIVNDDQQDAAILAYLFIPN